MDRFLALIFVLVTGSIAQGQSQLQSESCANASISHKIITYNILRSHPKGDASYGKWSDRVKGITAWIRLSNPDIFGAQEPLNFQVEDLAEGLSDYEFYGIGRGDGKTLDEFTPIFYKKSRYVLLDQGHFWLSEHPNQPGSIGWDSKFPRILTWVRLKDRSTLQELFVANTHFENSKLAPNFSAELASRRLKELADNPILIGDFNSLPDSMALETLLAQWNDSAADTKNSCRNCSTYVDGRRIDYVLVPKSSTVCEMNIDSLPYSDHYPISIRFVL